LNTLRFAETQRESTFSYLLISNGVISSSLSFLKCSPPSCAEEIEKLRARIEEQRAKLQETQRWLREEIREPFIEVFDENEHLEVLAELPSVEEKNSNQHK